ncbi:hypothetical protein KAT92_04905, partial [Candidatus Babeliales bacterium]|nr:hypothetical protein [Candidatus Babeliales bacterium]
TSDGTISLALRGATGVTTGALTGVNHAPCFIADGNLGIGISWPLAYHFHYSSTPDEIFIFIEYSGGHTQHMMFGEILKAAVFTGGAFYTATIGAQDGILPSNLDPQSRQFSIQDGGVAAYGAWQPLPFSGGIDYSGYLADWYAGSSILAETEGRTWWYSGDDAGFHVRASAVVAELIDNARNIWNQSVSFVPFLLFGMSNGLVSDPKIHLGEIYHLRFTNIRDLVFGEIVTIGSDQWKTYPLLKKNQSETGYLGLAVRYEL